MRLGDRINALVQVYVLWAAVMGAVFVPVLTAWGLWLILN